MTNKDDGFSLIIVVIFMSIAALFIGYLMGSWLISFLVDDEQAEMAENKQKISQRQNPVPEVQKKTADKKVNNSSNNLTAPKENNQAAGSNKKEQKNQKKVNYGVQIGAFSNYSNALTVKEKIEKMGYQVIVTDSSPHQVQVTGYPSRSQAETAAEELEKEGYPGFIVTRE